MHTFIKYIKYTCFCVSVFLVLCDYSLCVITVYQLCIKFLFSSVHTSSIFSFWRVHVVVLAGNFAGLTCVFSCTYILCLSLYQFSVFHFYIGCLPSSVHQCLLSALQELTQLFSLAMLKAWTIAQVTSSRAMITTIVGMQS